MKKMLLICMLFLQSTVANEELRKVQKYGLTIKYDNQTITIDRKKNEQCTSAHICPEDLWGGEYASKDVNKRCKKTFVTHVGLLQPITLGKGIQTVAELETLAHIKNVAKYPEKYVLIDARTPPWFEQMTIPTSVNLPFDTIMYDEDLEEDDFENEDEFDDYESNYENMFDILNIKRTEKGLDFSKAKVALLYCNGSWCSQSPKAIMKLINLGYPKEKLLWYRGGLQDWLIYDFTIEDYR